MARSRYEATIVVRYPKAGNEHIRPEEYEGEGVTLEDAISDALQRLPYIKPSVRKLLAEALR